MATYTLTEEAASDLRGIWQYIAADNETAADGVVASLVSSFEHLAKWQQTGRPRPEITPKPILFWPVRKFCGRVRDT